MRIVDFVSTLGYDMMPSIGKSRDAIRTIDLDDGLADVLRKQKVLQKTERGSDGFGSNPTSSSPGRTAVSTTR